MRSAASFPSRCTVGIRSRGRLYAGVASGLIPMFAFGLPTTANAATAVNTASTTAPVGAIEANTSNNSATDTDNILAVVTASNDTPASVNSAIGASSLINVLTNDSLNALAPTPADVTLTVTSPATNPAVVLDPATGVVSVAAGTPAGNYSIGYQICETLNPTNCATATVAVVVAAARSSLSGTVYSDTNSNRNLDSVDVRRSGWIVQVIRNDIIIAEVTTDANGSYNFQDLLSGSGYDVIFRHPVNRVVYGRINGVNLIANTNIVEQNLPIDPSGIVYDSVSRQPVAGAIVQLINANGALLPPGCFIDPSQARQTTAQGGEYRFDLALGAAAECPVNETTYHISITSPQGYSSGSTVIVPQRGALDPTSQSASAVGSGTSSASLPFQVNSSAAVPTGTNPPYFLDLRLAQGDPDVINNHIPIDPFLSRDPLIVTKTSPLRSANVGDLVPYEIIVRNSEPTQRSGVNVVDILPPGMNYVLGSASVNGVAQEPTRTDRQVLWTGQIIPGNGSARYNLTLVVGAAVSGGERVNTGIAQNSVDGSTISNRGTAVISILPSAVFDCSEVIGKVFEDRNHNGYQDDGEPGVPGVRLVTVNGLQITTDQYGRYHIACAAVPNARIGSNFVLKVDPGTLPLGWLPTGENPQFVRLTRGRFSELNFGVAPATSTPINNPADGAVSPQGGE